MEQSSPIALKVSITRNDITQNSTLTKTEQIKHNENTPIQIYCKFHFQKTENFQMKNSDIFHISAQNIDCGYSLEPPR